MLLSDELIYVITFIFATFFTTLTFAIPYTVDDEAARAIAVAPMAIRAVAFPIFSAIGWYVLAIFSLAANNCSFIFQACYTSPTFATTGSSSGFSGFLDLAWLFFGFGTLMVVVSVILGIMMYAAISIMTGRRKP